MALSGPQIAILPEPGRFDDLFAEFAEAQDSSATAALVFHPLGAANVHQFVGIDADSHDALACRASGRPTSA